jgi:Recombination endonuclease VII
MRKWISKQLGFAGEGFPVKEEKLGKWLEYLSVMPVCPHEDRPRYGFGLCRSCYDKARSSVGWKANPEREALASLKRAVRKYGITIDAYNQLLKEQDSRCAICGEQNNGGVRDWRLHIDHDHETDEVRGLLCSRCNLAIGHLREDRLLFEAAIDYLSKSWLDRNFKVITLIGTIFEILLLVYICWKAH